MASASLIPSLTAGTLLAGRYQIRRELGRGGMGIVYLCRDTFTGDSVALKRLFRADSPGDPEDVWWFRQEARCLAALSHPVIVRARDFGMLPDSTPFLAMDVAPGRSLLSWLEIAAIPWPWPYTVLWTFVDQILLGLAHAHARGVIHGDLKPTNLMLEFPGPSSVPRVFVLDLGLASLVRDPVDHRLHGVESPPVVRAGAGTPGWMAPEQIRRATPHYGPPTDLYAVGSILYHLLAGREPFTGTIDEVLEGHRNHPLPEFKPPANVPPETAAFVRKLMAKRPWQRFEYAGDARRAWEEIRPALSTEPWSFRLNPEPHKIEELTSIDGEVRRRSSPLELSASSGSALGLLALRPSPMVARHEERAELSALVEDLGHPQSRPQKLVLLYGEAGVGKSRLAEWLCDEVHEQAVMVPLRARYRRIPAPLDGIVGAVNQHFGLERADRNLVEKTLINVWEITQEDDEGLTLVAAAAEWLRPTPPGKVVPLGPTGKRFFFDTPEVRRKTVFAILSKIGRARPILLWLDDLHLASGRTFETVAKLRQEMLTLRILMVATARSEALAVDTEAVARLETLRHLYGGRVIDLRPLSPPDTEELLLSSLPLEEAAVKRATARSRGNPLFALQLLHAWAASNRLQFMADGRYSVPPIALEEQPGSTAELWDERLQAIPPELRRAAFAAAALGGDIPVVVLRALLSSLDIPVSDAINALTVAQILIPSGPGRLRWPHTLLQEHLLARLMERGDARMVFRKAADALALHPAAGTRRVVSHRVTNLLRAGDEMAVAERVLEFVESNWRRVRDVEATLNDLSRLSGLVSGPATAAYDRWRAEALRHMGQFAEARVLVERARRAFATMDDVKNEAHCLRLFGHILATQSIVSGREHVVRALSKFDQINDNAGRAECLLVLGEIDYFRGNHEGARGWLRQAARLFARIPDPLGEGQCLVLLGLTDLAGGKLERARERIEQARAEFEKLGYRLGIAECELVLGHLAHRVDALEEAITRAERARRMMQELRNPRGEAACQRLLGIAAFDSGDLMRAREHALSASALYDQMGEPRGQVECSLLLAQVAIAQGKPVAAELLQACEAIGLGEAEIRQHTALSKAWLHHAQGKIEEAMNELTAARLAFGDPRRSGAHTQQLLTKLAALPWPKDYRKVIDEWRGDLGVRKRERTRVRAKERAQPQDPE
jgi:serine/threonine protein kinase/tetratricopeptide (TPR) repeat protein